MVVAALLYAEWGRDVIRGDPLGYAYRLSTESLAHAMFNPPSGKYLIAVPLVLYKAMFELFQLDFEPQLAVAVGLILLCAGLLFLLLRERVGDLAAVPPVVLMLFFAPGWEVSLNADRIPSQIALTAGLAMLLVLERRDLRGDIAAAVLLTISLASHPIGIGFGVMAFVMIVLRGPPERLTRLWVAVGPTALYGVWYLSLRAPEAGRGPVSPGDVISFLGDSWVALTAGVTGLFSVLAEPAYDEPLGWIVGAILLGLIVWGVARFWWRLSPTFWAAVAGLVVLIVATRLSPGFTRMPEGPRYLYPYAFLLLIVLAEIASAIRAARWVLSAAALVLALSVGASVAFFVEQSGDVEFQGAISRAQLAGVELAGHNVDPDYQPAEFGPNAGEYLEAADNYGSIGFSPAELASQPEAVRLQGDRTLVESQGLAFVPAASTSPPPAGTPSRALGSVEREGAPPGCVVTASSHSEVALDSPAFWVRSNGLQEAGLNLGRFADQAFTPLTPPPPGVAAGMVLPADGIDEPWRLGIDSQEPVTVCGTTTASVQRPSSSLSPINLSTADLPPGWEQNPSATAGAAGLLECLGAPPATKSDAFVATPEGEATPVVGSDVLSWPRDADARRAFAAFRSVKAASCLESTLQRGLQLAGGVTTRPTAPADTASLPAAAYATTIGDQSGSASNVFILDGRTAVLVGTLTFGDAERPEPPLNAITRRLSERLARSH
jgi:hypothetical protein